MKNQHELQNLRTDDVDMPAIGLQSGAAVELDLLPAVLGPMSCTSRQAREADFEHSPPLGRRGGVYLPVLTCMH